MSGFSLVGRSKIANLIKTGEWEGSDFSIPFIDDPRNGLFGSSYNTWITSSLSGF